MKIIKILGIVLASIIGLVLILGLFAKKDVKVERSILIPSTNKEVIFRNLAMYDEFLKWNPWSSKDPNQKLTFSGEQGTVGSSYTWDGNEDVGKGTMTITGITQFERVEQDLHFIEPIEAHNLTTFTMSPEDEGYRVTWDMESHSPFPLNIFNLFMDMDKMIGPDFEKGLTNLKNKCVTETDAANAKIIEDAVMESMAADSLTAE